jgi:LPS O-antigen subunit length determinant protein (WzzB/FepE family)
MYSDRRKNSNYATSGLDSSDEIDVVDVLKKIWRGRVLIFSMVAINFVVTMIALALMPSYYRIEATVDAVTPIQLRPINPSVLSNIAESRLVPLEYQVPVLDEKKIYNRAILQINSLSLLKDFWEKHTGKVLNLSPNAEPTPESQAFKKFYQKFVLESSNPKLVDVSARKIFMESQSPTEGVKLLDEYLEFVNQQVWLELAQKLEVSYKANIDALTRSYNARNVIEQQSLSDHLIKVRESLKIAESLGIRETPFKSLENIQLRILDSQDYLMGTKSLAQQVDILVARQGKSLAPYSADLRNMEIWLEQMNTDLRRIKELDGVVRLFSVVNKPTSSLDPVAPKKTLILVAIVLLSGILGVFIVLIRSVVRAKKTASQ